MSRTAARQERIVALKCEGLLARRAGVPACANPFPANTGDAAAWARGWTADDKPLWERR